MENELTTERAAACALNRIFGYEPIYAVELIQNLGSARAVFDLDRDGLDEIFGPVSKYKGQIGKEALEKAGEELQKLQGHGTQFISFSESCYPSLLKECPDAPSGLYIRSSSSPEEIFSHKKMISMVGTRDISLYGKEWCPKLVGAMAQAKTKPTVVSGLAIGVDVECHLAALAYSLPTIAVIPTGIDDIYPKRHNVVAAKIAESEGSAIVTDFPPGTSPVQFNFLRRNRIIAGLSSATILVESKKSGGGTMTARLAAQYERDVFALPGRIEDCRSEGCNVLVREKIAEPITSMESLPELLGLGNFNIKKKEDLTEIAKRKYGSLPEQSRKEILDILTLIRERRGICAEEISSRMDLDYPRVLSLTGLLETDAMIEIDLLGRCMIRTKKV